MKISIRSDLTEKPEVSMKLWLKEVGDDVELVALAADDQEWVIGKITSRGLCLWGGIEDTSGWPLDSDGKIKLV